MKSIIIFIAVASLSACASMMPTGSPGTISVNNSQYDGAKEVLLTPGWANTGNSGFLKIGARKSSKMAKDEVILIVRNDFIKNFAFATPNFFVKIDGVESKFKPLDKTHCEVNGPNSIDVTNCSQEYMTDVSFIEKMVSAKAVFFKLNLEGNEYTEGSLENDRFMTAKAGLKEFLNKIKTEFNQPANKLSSL